jgi:chromosomal replication initiation ATPase DnaA
MKDIVGIILGSMEPVGVSREDLLGMSREQNIVAAREMVTRMLKEFTCMTDVNVGKIIGRGRNTVYYYGAQFDQRYRTEKNYKAMYDTISSNVRKMLEE